TGRGDDVVASDRRGLAAGKGDREREHDEQSAHRRDESSFHVSSSSRSHGRRSGALAAVGTLMPPLPGTLARIWIWPVRSAPPSATPQFAGETAAGPVQKEIWKKSFAPVSELSCTYTRTDWHAGVFAG